MAHYGAAAARGLYLLLTNLQGTLKGCLEWPRLVTCLEFPGQTTLGEEYTQISQVHTGAARQVSQGARLKIVHPLTSVLTVGSFATLSAANAGPSRAKTFVS